MKLDPTKLSTIIGLSIMTASELAVSYQVTMSGINQLSTQSVISELNRLKASGLTKLEALLPLILRVPSQYLKVRDVVQ